jgi:hypothetical protein
MRSDDEVFIDPPYGSGGLSFGPALLTYPVAVISDRLAGQMSAGCPFEVQDIVDDLAVEGHGSTSSRINAPAAHNPVANAHASSVMANAIKATVEETRQIYFMRIVLLGYRPLVSCL